jgi:hypothetical protein
MLWGDDDIQQVFGCFQSQVFGIGRQFGYVFPLSQGLQGYINLKGYKEFGASDRASGWNTWHLSSHPRRRLRPPRSHDHQIARSGLLTVFRGGQSSARAGLVVPNDVGFLVFYLGVLVPMTGPE